MLGAKQVQRQQLCLGGPWAGDAAGLPAAMALNITGNCLVQGDKAALFRRFKALGSFPSGDSHGSQCIQLANIREGSLYELNVHRISYNCFDLHSASREHQKFIISAKRNIGQRINLHLIS